MAAVKGLVPCSNVRPMRADHVYGSSTSYHAIASAKLRGVHACRICADTLELHLGASQAALLSLLSEAAVRELERDDMLPLTGAARTGSQGPGSSTTDANTADLPSSRCCDLLST